MDGPQKRCPVARPGTRMLSPSTPDPSVPTALRKPLWRRVTRAAVALVLLVFSVAVLAWLTLHWGILPRIEQWRPQIEERAGAAVGQPVRIGSIAVSSSGWVPAFDLRNVQLLDRQGRPALTLAQVRVALAPQSLLAFELRLAQLHVDGVELDVRRDSRGHISVAGLDMQAGTARHADDGAAADWLLAQQEIVVRRGTVRWTDELRGAPPLELRDVQFVLRNGLRRHDLRIDATPPEGWGERFSVRGRFTQWLLARRGDWQHWSGTLYADLPSADVHELRRHVGLPFDLDEGRGALRVWLELERGQWRDLTADVALADVSLRLSSALKPLTVSQLQTRLRARRDAGAVALAADRLGFTTGDGVVWPAGNLALEWQQKQSLTSDAGAASAPAAPVTGGRLRADRLDLALMASIASRLPVGAATERLLAELAPAGMASGLDVRWQGPFDAPRSYRAQGRVAGLTLAPQAASPPAPAAGNIAASKSADAASAPQARPPIGRPGLAGADIEFEATDTGGKARLAMKGGTLVFPGVFEQPAVPMDMLTAQVDWRILQKANAPPAIEVKVSEARFANADAQGDLRATWRTGKADGFGVGRRLPGEIDIAGHIVRARAERVAAYLPLGIPLSARRYVSRAVRAGVVDSGTFAAKGDIWQFPFHGVRDGVFRVSAKVRDAQVDYLPSVPSGSDEAAWVSPWPAFGAVQGEMVFDRSSMQLNGLQGRLWGVQLRNVRARIDDFAQLPTLHIDAEARGPLSDLLRYVDTTPLGQWIGGGLKPLTATGVGDLGLALSIPLHEGGQTSVRGSVALSGNDVRVRPGTPLLAGARGRVDFTQRGFTVVGASARVLGGDATFEGGVQPDGTMRFTAQGTASADGMRRATELGILPTVASKVRGQASYRLALGLAQGWPEITVTSDLVGVESDWPAPLNKAAATPWPLRWQSTMVPSSLKPGDKPRDVLRLDVGSVLQLRLNRDVAGETTRILGGAVGVLDAAPVVPTGSAMLQARLNLPVLDLDAWRKAWDGLPDGPNLAAVPLPATVGVRAQQVVMGARRFTDAAVELHFDPTAPDAPWRAEVRSAQATGRVTWRAPRDDGDAGRLTARLARLDLPAVEGVDVEPPENTEPMNMPALDVVVDDFEMRGRRLGRLELQAVTLSDPGRTAARLWRLDKLDVAVPEAHLVASGTWSPVAEAGGRRRMSLDFGIDLVDSGKLASRFGWADAVRGGKGRVQGRLAWDGSPASPSMASVEGQVNVALESGQFLRAEPGGVGRLLGILSLQSLPRRLLLDFRDVFQEGFSFDSVQGDVALKGGQARTDNLRMRGIQASVLMEGSADLVRESQDLHVVIVPEFNAGAASLAYAAINPAVALGTFVAQLVLRDPLRAAGTREFRVTGPLGDPKVERIDRAASAPLPAADSSPDTRRKDPPG